MSVAPRRRSTIRVYQAAFNGDTVFSSLSCKRRFLLIALDMNFVYNSWIEWFVNVLYFKSTFNIWLFTE